jgi:hypothetical protein
MNNTSSNPHNHPPFSSEAQAEGLRLDCITEGWVCWRLRSSPWGRADGIKITALKIEGVKGTPVPPDERCCIRRPRRAGEPTTHNDWRLR